VKLAGSQSWTFGRGIAQLPHAALYVRDVIGLEPPPDPVLPPRLAPADDELRDVLVEAGRAEAGAQWLLPALRSWATRQRCAAAG
jgi:hypothetical protein